ncbi:unnamed protein product [Musa hybrid cultivar]
MEPSPGARIMLSLPEIASLRTHFLMVKVSSRFGILTSLGGSFELSTAKNQKEQRIRGYPQCYRPVSCAVHVKDREWDQEKEAMEMGEAEEFAVYLNQAGELLLIPQE